MVLLKSEKKLKTGDKAPSFQLKDVKGVYYTLNSFRSKPLLVIFMCNHCPYVKAKFEAMKELYEKYKDKINMVGINSNESENYPEDSYENMKKTAKEKDLKFFYLHDETQEVAKKYGAVCTPDPFLFDENHELFYHGSIDDAASPGTRPSRNYMQEAIEALLKGRTLEKDFIPSMGCSIKWKQ